MYYFGATSQNVERRWRNGVGYKTTSLQPYIEKYGWENIQHIVLFRDQTKEDALWIEDFLIETAREDGVCINKQRSGNISKEEGYQQRQCKWYYEQNRNEIREQQREYRRKNKDKIKQYHEQYYEQNRNEIREQQREYYEQHKRRLKEQQS